MYSQEQTWFSGFEANTDAQTPQSEVGFESPESDVDYDYSPHPASCSCSACTSMSDQYYSSMSDEFSSDEYSSDSPSSPDRASDDEGYSSSSSGETASSQLGWHGFENDSDGMEEGGSSLPGSDVGQQDDVLGLGWDWPTSPAISDEAPVRRDALEQPRKQARLCVAGWRKIGGTYVFAPFMHTRLMPIGILICVLVCRCRNGSYLNGAWQPGLTPVVAAAKSSRKSSAKSQAQAPPPLDGLLAVSLRQVPVPLRASRLSRRTRWLLLKPNRTLRRRHSW